ncbi:MAG TPA: hypothetical protein VGB28_08585 [Actinomycetota bacterium]
MDSFMVINRHGPEECESLMPGLERPPEHLRGKPFWCPCPHGEHSFYMVVEGETAEDVIQGLPVEWRPGTRAIQLDVFNL